MSKAQDIDPTAFKLEKFEQKKYIFKADTVEEMTKWGGLMEQAANARTGVGMISTVFSKFELEVT